MENVRFFPLCPKIYPTNDSREALYFPQVDVKRASTILILTKWSRNQCHL